MNVQTTRLATRILAGICGVLLLLVIVQYAGLGRGYHWAPDADNSAGRAAGGAIDNKPVKLPPASAFAAIEAHPLFNEDRKPTPFDAAEGDDATAPPSPLNVALTGVILDEHNHVRIAMLQDKARNQSIALKVGMPLEGDQASWTLVEVKPRGAVFRSAANETTEIELETAVAPPPPARGSVRPPARPGQPARPGGRNAPNARQNGREGNANADLARRIEERRKQMREDAERLRRGEKPGQPSKSPE